MNAYAAALAAELLELSRAGADFIQVDEPAVLNHPEDWQVFSAAVDRLVAARQEAALGGRRPHLALYVYFGDAAPLYDRLVQLRVDVLGLDFTYGTSLVEKVVAEGAPMPLGLGLIDGRNTKLEDSAEVAKTVGRILPRVGGARAYLGASCGLELLPRDRAFAKLALLQQVRQAL